MSQAIEILIVDDNPNNLLTLHSLIDEEFDHVNVVEADSGLNALTFLMNTQVDLIILDIQMPHMDGFETAKIIQSRRNTRDIPIVFLTAAYKSEEFQKRGYDLGAVDYLTKPIDPERLTAKIDTYLRFIQHKSQSSKVQKSTPEETSSSQLVKHKQIENINHELHTALNTIINCSEKLKEEAIKLGYNNCLSDIEEFGQESRSLLFLLRNVLEPKLAS